MLDKSEAEGLVRDELQALSRRLQLDEEIVIIEEATVERSGLWVFFYNTRSYLQTGEIGRSLVGNDPIIVDRRDGSIHYTTTSRSIEEIVTDYEARTSDPSSRSDSP